VTMMGRGADIDERGGWSGGRREGGVEESCDEA